MAAWAKTATAMQAAARRYVARRAARAMAAIAAAEAEAREALREYASCVALLSRGRDLGASRVGPSSHLTVGASRLNLSSGLSLGASRSDLGASHSNLGLPGADGGDAAAHLHAAQCALEQLAALWRDGGEALAACLPEEAYIRLQVRNTALEDAVAEAVEMEEAREREAARAEQAAREEEAARAEEQARIEEIARLEEEARGKEKARLEEEARVVARAAAEAEAAARTAAEMAKAARRDAQSANAATARAKVARQGEEDVGVGGVGEALRGSGAGQQGFDASPAGATGAANAPAGSLAPPTRAQDGIGPVGLPQRSAASDHPEIAPAVSPYAPPSALPAAPFFAPPAALSAAAPTTVPRACDAFRVDLAAAAFGTCVCGEPRASHEENALRRPAANGAPFGTPLDGPPSVMPSNGTPLAPGCARTPIAPPPASPAGFCPSPASILHRRVGGALSTRIGMLHQHSGPSAADTPPALHLNQASPSDAARVGKENGALPSLIIITRGCMPMGRGVPGGLPATGCDHFRIDLASSSFGKCICGRPKAEHAPAALLGGRRRGSSRKIAELSRRLEAEAHPALTERCVCPHTAPSLANGSRNLSHCTEKLPLPCYL
jgi:hypothetical protein